MKAIWEGRDTKGRQVRAYLVTDERAKTITVAETNPDDPHDVLAWGAQRIASHINLPAIEFRVQQEWQRQVAESSETWAQEVAIHNDHNESRARLRAQGHKHLRQLPPLKYSGRTWVRVLTMSFGDLVDAADLGTPIGLEQRYSPGMARLAVADVQALCVMVDRALEQRGAA